MWKWKGMDRTCHRLNEQRRKDRSLPAENTLLSQSNYFEYAGAAGGGSIVLVPFRVGASSIYEKRRWAVRQHCRSILGYRCSHVCKSCCLSRNGTGSTVTFAHMEEIDLCWRMKRAGYKIMCCPASVVYHIGGGTLPKTTAGRYT